MYEDEKKPRKIKIDKNVRRQYLKQKNKTMTNLFKIEK